MLFLRLSVLGVAVPNQVHTDNSMGQYSLMLYLTPDEFIPESAGTGFYEHKATGLRAINTDPKMVELARKDSNTPEAWERYDMCPMKANRGCIFDAHLFHKAEPTGGFGDSQKNGRLVLTAFYDLRP